MKKLKYNFWVCPLLVIYIYIFQLQDGMYKKMHYPIHPLPDHIVLKAVAGYMRHLFAEIAFVNSAIFLGSIDYTNINDNQIAILGNNYNQINQLYPEFVDPYYFSQAYLAGRDPVSTKIANNILARGRVAYPENLIFPFYQGVNSFRFLDNPLEAAKIFKEGSEIPNAPPIFAHMAAILSAEGGELEASIISLETILTVEKNEVFRERYSQELVMMRKALEVQRATIKYYEEVGKYPENLNDLVPVYLQELPIYGTAFEMEWKPPIIIMRRPHF